MCWSKHEREQWERERREAELEAERSRFVASEPAEEPEPVAESEERARARPRVGGSERPPAHLRAAVAFRHFGVSAWRRGSAWLVAPARREARRRPG
jgi:hypothetical protein